MRTVFSIHAYEYLVSKKKKKKSINLSRNLEKEISFTQLYLQHSDMKSVLIFMQHHLQDTTQHIVFLIFQWPKFKINFELVFLIPGLN